MKTTITLDLRHLVLLLVGISFGAAPFLLGGEAQANNGGSWKCYVADQLDDPKEAAQWKKTPEVAAGLNEVAGHVPTGTVITVGLPVGNAFGTTSGGVDLICVK